VGHGSASTRAASTVTTLVIEGEFI
jgi:hypothetical protein